MPLAGKPADERSELDCERQPEETGEVYLKFSPTLLPMTRRRQKDDGSIDRAGGMRLILSAPSEAGHVRDLAFQAGLAAAAKKSPGRVLFIAPKKMSAVPPSVRGMPRASDEDVSRRLRLAYPKNFRELAAFLTAATAKWTVSTLAIAGLEGILGLDDAGIGDPDQDDDAEEEDAVTIAIMRERLLTRTLALLHELSVGWTRERCDGGDGIQIVVGLSSAMASGAFGHELELFCSEVWSLERSVTGANKFALKNSNLDAQKSFVLEFQLEKSSDGREEYVPLSLEET